MIHTSLLYPEMPLDKMESDFENFYTPGALWPYYFEKKHKLNRIIFLNILKSYVNIFLSFLPLG